MLFLVATFRGQLLYCQFLCYQRYVQASILSYFIMTRVCQSYERTSLLVVLLEDTFYQLCSFADIPAAVASPCVETFQCHLIATGILLNNFGSTL